MKKALVPILVVFMLLPWILYVREVSRSAGPQTDEPQVERSDEKPVPNVEEGSRQERSKPVVVLTEELESVALHAVAEERSRILAFEEKLGELEGQYIIAKSYHDTGEWTSMILLVERCMAEFPGIELMFTDSRPLEYRSTLLKTRFWLLLVQARLATVHSNPPADKGTIEQHKIRLTNHRLELTRRLEELEDHGPPEPRALDFREESVGGSVYTFRDHVKNKLEHMAIDVDFSRKALGEIIGYLENISGLNFVIQREEDRLIPVTIHIKSVVLNGVIQQLADIANLKWDVDAYGIIVLSPP